jgi:hypothetical protein
VAQDLCCVTDNNAREEKVFPKVFERKADQSFWVTLRVFYKSKSSSERLRILRYVVAQWDESASMSTKVPKVVSGAFADDVGGGMCEMTFC